MVCEAPGTGSGVGALASGCSSGTGSSRLSGSATGLYAGLPPDVLHTAPSVADAKEWTLYFGSVQLAHPHLPEQYLWAHAQ